MPYWIVGEGGGCVTMIGRTTLLAGTLGLGGDDPGGRRTSPLEREGYRIGPLSTAIGALVWNAPGGDGANEALVSRYRPRKQVLRLTVGPVW